MRRHEHHPRRRRGPILLAILATGGMAAGSLVGAAGQALAQPDDEGTSTQGDDEGAEGEQDEAGDDLDGEGASELAPIMLILDASGSMAADDGDAQGMTRMEAARQAVTQLAGAAPDAAELGLVVYGANVSSAPEDKDEGCEDIEVLAAPQAGQAGQITSMVSGIEASGYTPIGDSLLVADDELPDEGERSIILVSDGLDTCAPPPPCEVAADLAGAGVDLTLHAIGFKVDDEARADLECIAQEGGGTYADAEDADELADELARAAMRGMRGYELAGTPVEGGDTPMQASQIDAGDYVDVLEEGGTGLTGRGGTEKYYRVAVQDGERVHVTATMIGPDGTRSVLSGGVDNASLNLGMITDQEESCEGVGSNSGATLNMNDGLLAWGISAPVGSQDCEGSEVIIGVQRSGSLMAEEPFDLEILVRVEPAGLETTGMPGPATDVDETDLITTIETGEQAPELFGTGFGDATLIEPGTYSARVVTGERNFLRVPVSYGQTLRYAVEIEDGPEPELVTGLDDIGRFGAALFNPLRQPMPVWDGEEVAGGVRTSTGIGNGFAANLPTEVNFANRDGQVEELQPVYLGGEYYLVIGFDQPLADQEADAEQLEWTYNLVVEVDGEPLDGPDADVWDGEAQGEGEELDREDTSDQDKAEGASEEEGEEPAETVATESPDEDDGAEEDRAVAPFVLAGGALLLVAGGAAWFAIRQFRG